MAQSNEVQIPLIMQAVLDSLGNTDNWGKTEHSQWLVQAGVEWAHPQHRHAVPTWLLERFLATPDSASRSIHATLTSMAITVFTSSIPIVYTSASDIVSKLISLVIRRSVANPDGPLLPVLVESISSLGTRVHYADQIRDVAEELISQLVIVETHIKPGVPNGGRTQAIRCLLAGLRGVQAAAVQPTKYAGRVAGSKTPDTPTVLFDRENEPGRDRRGAHPPLRAGISPDIWQGTLVLLCDGDYAVRADYTQALVSYIGFGIPKEDEYTGPDGTRHKITITGGPEKQVTPIMHSDSVTRFLNALHAYVYALATTESLGVEAGVQNSASPSPTPLQNQQISGKQRLSALFPVGPRSGKPSPASLSDYGHILEILVAVHEHLPVRALLVSVPMLLALDDASKEYWEREPRRYNALQEVLARVWLTLGKVWDCAPVITGAEEVRRPCLL